VGHLLKLISNYEGSLIHIVNIVSSHSRKVLIRSKKKSNNQGPMTNHWRGIEKNRLVSNHRRERRFNYRMFLLIEVVWYEARAVVT